MERRERNFYQQLKRNLRHPGGVHLQRIETSISRGVPDVNYCIAGGEGWIELKAWERKTLSGTFRVPKLRPEQVAWLTRRSRVGGRAWLLCRMNQRILLFSGAVVTDLADGNVKFDDVPHVANVVLNPPINWENLVSSLIN